MQNRPHIVSEPLDAHRHILAVPVQQRMDSLIWIWNCVAKHHYAIDEVTYLSWRI
jgi:hypothetical protein